MFPYETLPTQVREEVCQLTTELHGIVRRTSEGIVQTGQHLRRVKAVIGHGRWEKWLDAEFGWSRDTAQRIIRVADGYDQKPQIAVFGPSAMYLLTSPSTPQTALDEVLERCNHGQKLGYKAVKEIIEEHRKPTPAEEVRNLGPAEQAEYLRRAAAEEMAAIGADDDDEADGNRTSRKMKTSVLKKKLGRADRMLRWLVRFYESIGPMGAAALVEAQKLRKTNRRIEMDD